MDLPLPRRLSGRIPPRSPSVPLTSPSAALPLFAAPHPVAHTVPLTPPPTVSPVSSTSDRLDDLMREQAVLAHLKSNVPMIWEMVECEIQNLHQNHTPARIPRGLHHSLAPSLSSPLSAGGVPRTGAHLSFSGARGAHSPATPCARKRIKLPVPADKYPDYNFVGRLLGPRGTTLKKLERDTGCKIMIRGRGSVRKDKETEVRGKPGWEHVFNENLHVVIEVSDTVDDCDATRILTRAKEMVELLLVPMPEDRDTLKRQQLRVLAILNGTFRNGDGQGGLNTVQSPRHDDVAQVAGCNGGGGRVPAARVIPAGRDFDIIGSAVSIGEAPSM